MTDKGYHTQDIFLLLSRNFKSA